MIGGHYFKWIRDHRAIRETALQPNETTLIELLSSDVVKRFVELNGSTAAIPLALSVPEDAEDLPSNPCHPACAEHAGRDYCRESWLLHLAELKSRPETHWHKCDYDKLCTIVPVVYHDRCWAVIKLACPATVPEDDFERQVELLDILVKDFVDSRADFLGQLLWAKAAAAELDWSASRGQGSPTERRPSHPQIRKALKYIEAHLSDQKLTVSCVARELRLHPDYLSKLFAAQVGHRMSRFITARRVELAKTLLTTTEWQVKRIAHDTGHANPNWFSYVFRVLTGLTPGDYRKESFGRSPNPPAP